MILTDAQGLAVTTDSEAGIAGINQFTEQLLGYGANADIILQAGAADPDSPLINALVAAFQLWVDTPASIALAAEHLAQAQSQVARSTERERLFVAAIAAWAEGDLHRAVAYHQSLAEEYPRDLVSVHIAQYHYLFGLGDNLGMLQLIERVLPHNRENHYVHGMLAFVLEQCHDLAAAEVAGRRAVQMERRDPWAHHAIAHVLETAGRPDEGIAWLESLADTWVEGSTFRCHNYWHLALYYLKQQNYDQVMELYDRQVWGQAIKTYSHCQINAISLLLRLELEGINVGNRWQDIAAHLNGEIHAQILPLTVVHQLYALQRAGQSALVATLLTQLRDHAQTLPENGRRFTWSNVILPTARGMIAHAQGDWSATITHLEASRPGRQAVGGSHAQRSLFEQAYRDAQTKYHQQIDLQYS